MKKQTLFFVLLFAFTLCNLNRSQAQVTKESVPPPNYKFKTNNRPPFVDANVPHDTNTKRSVVWCEYGDGGFTTDSLSISRRRLTSNYKTLLLASTIYDTTKDGLAKFFHFDYAGTDRTPTSSDNDESLTNADFRVAITPSITSIVPSDTMVFAVTYRIPPQQDGIYKLVFLYNNDTLFNGLTTNNNYIGDPVNNLKLVRCVHDEATSFDNLLSSILSLADPNSVYKNYVVFDNLRPANSSDTVESNVFITLEPKDSIALGSTGSVKAVLVRIIPGSGKNPQSQYSIAGKDSLIGMPVARSHDPNYINQEKHCITTPKDNTTLKYHIHFQNDGEGVADKVTVRVGLPVGIRFTDLTFIRASIGSQDNYLLVPERGLGPDSVVFKFDHANLIGTKHNPNGFSDPNTMGDIFFTVKTNSSFVDTIYSQAVIYFHSGGTGGSSGSWEAPVFTRKAISYFTKCCDCLPPTPPCNCKKLLNLCWWWWVAIGAGIIILWWFIIWRRRKHRRSRQYDNT